MASSQSLEKTRYPGIYRAHQRGCRWREGRRCRCPRSYQATVFDARANKLIRKHFADHARGDAGSDSDLDFLVIERDVPNRHAEMVRLTRELHSLRVPVDVLVVSEAYAEDWGGVEGTVVHAALTEGREFAAA